MSINKPMALAMLIVNVIYSIISITLFFYLHHTIMIDFTKQSLAYSDIIGKATLDLLSMIIIIGLVWIQFVFKEALWIRIGSIIWLLLKLLTTMIIYWLPTHEGLFEIYGRTFYFYTSFVFIMYAIMSLLFVKAKEVRIYFRYISILIMLAAVLPSIGGWLYDNMGTAWLEINPDALLIICFIVTLLLFTKVYFLSVKNTNTEIAR